MSSTNTEASIIIVETIWETNTYTPTSRVFKQPDPPQAPNNATNSLGIIIISIIVGLACILLISMITSKKINRRNNTDPEIVHTANPLRIHSNPLHSDIV